VVSSFKLECEEGRRYPTVLSTNVGKYYLQYIVTWYPYRVLSTNVGTNYRTVTNSPSVASGVDLVCDASLGRAAPLAKDLTVNAGGLRRGSVVVWWCG
jgi:hypothetical protein